MQIQHQTFANYPTFNVSPTQTIKIDTYAR